MKNNNESKLNHVMNWSSQRLEINLKKIMKGCILKVESPVKLIVITRITIYGYAGIYNVRGANIK